MTIKMKDSELLKLMEEVSAEVTTLLKSEDSKKPEESSSSSSSGSDAPPVDEGSASGSPPSDNPGESSASVSASGSPSEESSSGSSSGSSPDAMPPAPAGDPAAAAPAAPAPAAGAPAPAAGAPAPDQGQPDVNSLTQAFVEIGQKNPEELKTYYLACVAAIKQVMGGGNSPAPDAGQAPAAPAPQAAPAPAAPMMKSEAIKFADVKEIKDLQSEVETLSKAIKLMLETPVRKAITGVSFVARTEEPAAEMSRDVVLTKLNERITDLSLTKSDRERIDSYVFGNIGFDGIKDLLK